MSTRASGAPGRVTPWRRGGRLRLLPLLAAALSLGFAAEAAPRKVDPRVLRAASTGLTGQVAGPARRAQPPAPALAPVLIELARDADAQALAALEGAGARLERSGGRALFYRRFVPARVDLVAASALDALALVSRVSLLAGKGPPPLDRSAELTGLEGARGSRPALDRLTGEGVVIGDVDTNADLFHPVFFRGDGGYFDWIDTDGDGAFTPGVDAIDLDADGAAGPGEAAALLRAETMSMRGAVPAPGARAAGFDPATDWLYLDTNGNGARDFGAHAGFDDSAPALGEPLFVPDDLNRNGKLDVGERVIRLKTSKFRKVSVALALGNLGVASVKHVFTRGVDLARHKVDYTHSAIYGYADALHATSVLSIIAGDLPLAGRRWVGFAPDADLVLAWQEDSGQQMPAAATTWLLGEKPDVMLYEISPWTGMPLDGSDPMSKLIDASSSDVAHTCPSGDQAAARKHAGASLAPGVTATLPFELPSKLASGKGPASYVDLTLHLRGAAVLDVSLVEPSGLGHDLSASPQGSLSGGGAYVTTSELTDRGTRMVDVILYTSDPASAPLPTGGFSVKLSAGGSGSGKVDAYLSDDVSGFGLGAAWTKEVASDDSTLGVPSTADHCITVGAVPCHPVEAGKPWYDFPYGNYDLPPGFTEADGQVRAYSPRGPRIDGVQKPDLLAPDNPWAATPSGLLYPKAPAPFPNGAVIVFGGTSGASPHVTGSAALLVQAGIRGDAVRDALRAGAVADAVTGPVPNKDYGHGRLDIGRSLGAKPTGAAPTLSLVASPPKAAPGAQVTLSPTGQNPQGSPAALEIKWDDGYDGSWDVPYGPLAERTVTHALAGRVAYKARVRNETGQIGEAVVWVSYEDGPPAPDAGPDAAGEPDADAPPDAGEPEGTAPMTPDASLPAAGAGGSRPGPALSQGEGGGCVYGVAPRAGGCALALGALGLLALVRRRRAGQTLSRRPRAPLSARPRPARAGRSRCAGRAESR